MEVDMRIQKFGFLAILVTALGLSACGSEPQEITTVRPFAEDAGPCVNCETVDVNLTFKLPSMPSDSYLDGVSLAPATPGPTTTYVCGTVNGLALYAGNDCVTALPADFNVNTVRKLYTLRVGPVYKVALQYGGQVIATNLIGEFPTGGASVPITGYIIEGGQSTPQWGTTGVNAYGRTYACVYIDRNPSGNLQVFSYNVAPCNAQVADYIDYYMTDSELTVTSATDVFFKTSFMIDNTGPTFSQPTVQVAWNAGLGLHSYRLWSVPIGMEHWTQATTPQTNPTTGLRINLTDLVIGEISLNSVVTNPGTRYQHFENFAVAATAPDEYSATATQITVAAPHLEQEADNGTATGITP